MERFLGKGLPYRAPATIPGRLLTIEGGDFSGRRTQIARLAGWLEAVGYAVLVVGPEEQGIVADVIREGKAGLRVGHLTLGLLQATDLADTLENRILPALMAGFHVLADRYVFSRMARDLVRGSAPDWLDQMFGFALRPDLAVYLQVPPSLLLHRGLQKQGYLDYWQSGLDMGLSPDRVTSFLRYQERLGASFLALADRHGLVTVDGGGSVEAVGEAIEREVRRVLELDPA